MGKGLESIGVIEGYNIVTIGKLKAKKAALFQEIEKYDDKIMQETRDIVNNSSGEVFAIVKKGIIKGIYLFAIEGKEDSKTLKHLKTVYVDEVTSDVREKYNNHILDIVKDSVSMQEYDKVILEDKVVQVNSKDSKEGLKIATIGGFLMGLMIGWMIFDNILLGLLWGIIFAPVFSGVDVVVTNKRGRKKKDNK